MLLVPEISEGRDIDVSLFGPRPHVSRVYIRDEEGDFMSVEDKQAIQYGDGDVAIRSGLYRPTFHQDHFTRMHEVIQKKWGMRLWKTETATSHNGRRARVSWIFKGKGATFSVGGDSWHLQVRAFNSYDKFFALGVELGVVHSKHGGRIAFRNTQQTCRRRGDNPTGRLIEKMKGLIKEADSLIVEPLERLNETFVSGEDEVDKILENFSHYFFPDKEKKEVRLRFLAGDGYKSLLDLLGLVGAYAVHRMTAISRQVMYQQELLFREMADVADLK